jgi:hypothetical protein
VLLGDTKNDYSYLNGFSCGVANGRKLHKEMIVMKWCAEIW